MVPTRVLLDARMATRGLGISTFVRGLADAMVAVAETVARTIAFGLSPQLHREARRADVIHFASNLFSFRTPKRSVITVYDLMFLDSVDPITVTQRLAYREAIRSAGQVVCISEIVRDSVALAVPSVADTLMVVPAFGRDCTLGDSNSTELKKYSCFVAFAGEGRRKRSQALVEIYRSYRERAGHDALPLVVFARAANPDGELAKELVGVGAQLCFDATASDVRSALQSAVALLFPSEQEGLGIPLLEAAGVGTPALVDAAAQLPGEAIGTGTLLLPDPFTHPGVWAAMMMERQRRPEVASVLQPTWAEIAHSYERIYRDVRQRHPVREPN
jgi:glycosyltransferase involved in cell wall biosynthesis